MEINNDIEFDNIESENDDFYSDDDIYNFTSWGADLSFRELIDRYEANELLKPELQRNYVWDRTEASRFIDSILLGLPVPSIFLAKTPQETLLIIDGYQRIMTVHDFVKGIFSDDKKVFKLTNSKKINQRWRGKAFSELGEIEQRRIRNTTIHAIIFSEKKPAKNNTGLYQVFERINTGGRTLFPQEIRNCVYQDKNMNRLLFSLNKNPTWRRLYGSEKVDSRMRDMEMILRFFAIRHIYLNPPSNQSISLKKELNLYMEGDEENNSIDSLAVLFKVTIEKVNNFLGINAFHNLTSRDDEFILKFNPTIYDSIMIAFSLPNKKPKNNILEQRLLLIRDTTYQDAIRTRTTEIEKINTRVNLVIQYLME